MDEYQQDPFASQTSMAIAVAIYLAWTMAYKRLNAHKLKNLTLLNKSDYLLPNESLYSAKENQTIHKAHHRTKDIASHGNNILFKQPRQNLLNQYTNEAKAFEFAIETTVSLRHINMLHAIIFWLRIAPVSFLVYMIQTPTLYSLKLFVLATLLTCTLSSIITRAYNAWLIKHKNTTLRTCHPNLFTQDGDTLNTNNNRTIIERTNKQTLNISIAKQTMYIANSN